MPYFDFVDWPEIALDDDPMVPLDARPELPWLGFPPSGGNDAHSSDVYDSLEAEIPGRNSEALYYSLTGNELTATVSSVSEHSHDGENTILDWRPLWRWCPMNGLAGAGLGNGQIVVNSSTEKTVGYGIFTLPAALITRPTLFPRMRATIPGQGATNGTLFTRWRIYTMTASNSKEFGGEVISPHDLGMYSDAAYARPNHWVEGDPMNWLGVSVPPVAHASGKYVFYIKVSAWIMAGDALLSELQLALRSWGS